MVMLMIKGCSDRRKFEEKCHHPVKNASNQADTKISVAMMKSLGVKRRQWLTLVMSFSKKFVLPATS